MSVDEQLPKVRSRRWAYYVPVLAVGGFSLASSVARSIATGEPAFAMQTTGFAIALVAITIGPYLFLRRRAIRNLRRVLAARNTGLRFIPVRSSHGLRLELATLTGQERPHRPILDATLVFVDAGSRLELWGMGRGGPERRLRLPWKFVETVTFGTVSHLEEDERAVLLAGNVNGRPFTLGLPPQDIDGWFTHPVDDTKFLSFAAQLKSAQSANRAAA